MAQTIDEAIAQMQAEVSAVMLPLMLDIGEHVAEEARAGHTYRNRTGRLERSTQHGAASGNLRTGYRVDVVARRPYATYVDEGTSRNRPYPFLVPAWDRSEEWAQRLTERVLLAAVAEMP